MLALPLIVALLAGQSCTVATVPLAPTIRIDGDSRMQGGLCSSTSPTAPAGYMDAALPGGTAGGWLVKNAGVTGTTPAQQRAAYENATTGAAKSCNGERCGYQVVGGAANCLRVGTAAATCLADHTWMVDDALSNGVGVVWFNETSYVGWNMAAGTEAQVPVFNGLWLTACSSRAASNPRLKCVDIYTASGVPKTNTCDGIHDNQTGTNQLGAWLLAALLTIR
jgi:hypothetical protein